MARDRQRAKQRRAQRRSGARSTDAAARDARPGGDDDVVRGADGGRAVDDDVVQGPDGGRAVDDDVVQGPDGGRAIEDDVVDSPLGEGTAAPDPLDHSSAEVDQALLGEAGAVSDADAGAVYEDELDDDERDRAPDAVEGDAVAARRAGAHDVEHERRQRGRFITFLGHCVDELRRVQWPNRRHVGQATAVVLGFVVVAGGYLGLLDALWQPLIEAIL